MALVETLMHEIVSRPDDDTPRRVLADWLMDQPDAGSQARGEFIQVQCRLARLACDDPLRDELEARERQLWPEYPQRWARPYSRRGAKAWSFAHGLVEEVALDTNSFDRLRDRLCQDQPVRRLRLLGSEGWRERLESWPDLERVAALRTETYEVELLRSPCLAGLRELEVRWAGVGTLLTAPCAAALEALDLRHSFTSPEELRALFQPQRLPRLRALGLGPITFRTAHPERPPLPPRLSCLWCDSLMLGELVPLLTAIPDAPLEELSLIRCSNDARAGDPLAVLLRLPALARLRRLELAGMPLSRPALTGLRELLQRGLLVWLVLRECLAEGEVIELARAGRLTCIRELVVAGAPTWRVYPSERCYPLGGAAVRALTAAPLPALVALELSGHRLTADDLRALIDAPFITQMHTLVLRDNGLGAGTAEVLLRRGVWPRLGLLDVRGNALSRADRDLLRSRLGVRVRY
jgi:uncharacterized protein (TIGR02996 family)